MPDSNFSKENNKDDALENRAFIIIAFHDWRRWYAIMFQFLSVLIGLACAAIMAFGLLPLLGWIQWAVLLGCVLGVIFGAFCDKKIGLTINLVVGAVAVLRLFLGGGLF